MKKLIHVLLFALIVIVPSARAAAAPVEIWISPIGTEGGSGTVTDPYRTPNQDAFFNLIHGQPRGALPAVDIPENSTVHLLPGTFLVREGYTLGGNQRYGLTPKNGWKIRGAGIDVTVLKVMDNHPPALTGGPTPKLTVIGGNGSGSQAWEVPVNGVEVSDLTVDLNLAGQSVPHAPSAVALSGSNNRVSRVKGINWGCTHFPNECFVISVLGHYQPAADGYHNGVVEDCIVEKPAQVLHLDVTTAINVGQTSEAGYSDKTAGGWAIRGCFVRDITAGTALGQPKNFNAYSGGGRGVEIANNHAVNLISGLPGSSQCNGVYADTFENQDVTIRDNTFENVNNGIYFNFNPPPGGPQYSHTNIAVIDNLITVTNGGKGIVFWHNSTATKVMRKVRVEGNTVYPHVTGGIATPLSISGDVEFSANNNILESGGGSLFDFHTSGPYIDVIKVLSFKNNINLRGKPLTLGDWVRDEVFKGFYEEELTFTPTTSGWHKALLISWFASARLNVYSRGTSTDLGLAFGYNPDLGSLGEISMPYNNSRDGVGAIPYVRLAKYATLGSAESTQYGGWANSSIDLNISASQVGVPITIRISGMLRPPPYLANFTPYVVPTTPSIVNQLTIGSGFRTTGLIYAGSTGQQVTDGGGKVISSALNTVGTSQGGFGQDVSLLAANRFPYATGSGGFAFGTMTPFTLGLLDDADAATARATLGFPTGTAGSMLVGNGSSWNGLAIGTAGKALVSNGTSPIWADALQESAEASSTPVADSAQVLALPTTTRFFDFVQLPTTEKFYTITGIEWKNGATAAGGTISGVVIVDQIPPVMTGTPTVAVGQFTPNSGAGAVQGCHESPVNPFAAGQSSGFLFRATTPLTPTESEPWRARTIGKPLPFRRAAMWQVRTTNLGLRTQRRLTSRFTIAGINEARAQKVRQQFTSPDEHYRTGLGRGSSVDGPRSFPVRGGRGDYLRGVAKGTTAVQHGPNLR